jgi:hypothetical protein
VSYLQHTPPQDVAAETRTRMMSMKQGNLLLSSLFTLLLTAFVLTHTGWLPSKRTCHANLRHGEAHSNAKTYDFLSTETGRRWRTGQPTHWRGYILQR